MPVAVYPHPELKGACDVDIDPAGFFAATAYGRNVFTTIESSAPPCDAYLSGNRHAFAEM